MNKPIERVALIGLFVVSLLLWAIAIFLMVRE